jgi:hypothetical protein
MTASNKQPRTRAPLSDKEDVSNWILSDLPVNTPSDDKLWQGSQPGPEGTHLGRDSIIFRQIHDIAARITAPFRDSSSVGSGPLTFAVHGRWGSGKTSFIKMILKQSRENLVTLAVPQECLIECWYHAAAYDGSRLSPRATLAMQILLALVSEDRVAAVRLFAREIDQADLDDFLRDDCGNGSRNEKISGYLESIAIRLADLVGFDQIIRAELEGNGDINIGKQKSLVVVIDDLDRCSAEFVSSILETIQQWNNVDNLFFVLAADHDVLNHAIANRYGSFGIRASAEVALEKYIQHSIEIPELSPDQLIYFVRELLKPYDQDSTAQALAEHADILAAGIRVRTPRGVKRCLNTIRPGLLDGLHTTLNQNLNKKEIRLLLKERILEYTWREFYRNFYLRAQGKQNQFSAAIASVERASVIFAGFRKERGDEDREQLEFGFHRVRERLKVTDAEMPTDLQLAALLSLEPWFFLSEMALHGNAQDILAGISSADVPETVLSAESILAKRSAVQEIESLSREANAYYQQQNHHGVVDCAIRARQLFQKSGSQAFTANEVADFGNLALWVENIATATGNPDVQAIALDLYGFAFSLNQYHANNSMNFVSFILDATAPILSDHYPFCDQILTTFSSEQQAHDKARWLLLRAELAFKAHLTPSWEEYLDQMVELIDGTGKARDFERLVTFYSDIRGVEGRQHLKRAARLIIPRLSGQERNTSLLIYADHLQDLAANGKGIGPDMPEALEVYRYALRPIAQGGFQSTATVRRSAKSHNYALSLLNAGYRQEAGNIWFDGYHDPSFDLQGDFRLIQAYAAYLKESCKRPDLAEKVRAGDHPLPEKVVSEEGTPIPDHFVPGGIQALFNVEA